MRSILALLAVITTVLIGSTHGRAVFAENIEFDWGSTSLINGQPKLDVISVFTGSPPRGIALDAKLLVREMMTGLYAGPNGIFPEATATREILSPDHMRRDMIGIRIFGLGPAVMNITQTVTKLTANYSEVVFTVSGALRGKFWMKYIHNDTRSVISEEAWNTDSNNVMKSISSLLPFASSFIASVHARGVRSMYENLAIRVNRLREE